MRVTYVILVVLIFSIEGLSQESRKLTDSNCSANVVKRAQTEKIDVTKPKFVDCKARQELAKKIESQRFPNYKKLKDILNQLKINGKEIEDDAFHMPLANSRLYPEFKKSFLDLPSEKKNKTKYEKLLKDQANIVSDPSWEKDAKTLDDGSYRSLLSALDSKPELKAELNEIAYQNQPGAFCNMQAGCYMTCDRDAKDENYFVIGQGDRRILAWLDPSKKTIVRMQEDFMGGAEFEFVPPSEGTQKDQCELKEIVVGSKHINQMRCKVVLGLYVNPGKVNTKIKPPKPDPEVVEICKRYATDFGLSGNTNSTQGSSQ